MNPSLLAQAANDNDGGSTLLGVFVFVAVFWFVIYIFRPRKNKGWNIDHQGSTTIKPRK